MKCLFFNVFLAINLFLGISKINAQEDELVKNYSLFFKYYDAGNFAAASSAINLCAEIFEKGRYNLEDTNYAYIKTYQGQMFNRFGEIEKAIEAEIISKQIFVSFYGENSISNKYSLQNLASYYADANLLEISNKYYLELISVIKKIDNSKHKDIPSILFLIYSQYFYANNFNLAIRYANETIEENEKIYGKNTIKNIKIYDDISLYYDILGDFNKSISYELKSIKMYEKLIGKNDSTYIYKLNGIALNYLKIDSLDKSNYYIEKSIKICKEISGEKSPQLARSYNILGRILSREGKFESANEKYYEALKIQKLNDLYPSKFTATLFNNIALNKMELGQYTSALDLFEQAIKEDTIIDPTSINNLGLCQNNIGLYKDAASNFERALIILEKENGKQDIIATTLNNLSVSYLNMSCFDKALTSAFKALKINESIFGKEHSNTMFALNNIAQIYFERGEIKKALEFYMDILDNARINNNNNARFIAVAYNNIALCYEEMGDYSKALENYEISLSKTIDLLGENHPSVADNLNNTGCCYLRIGETDKALRKLLKAQEMYAVNNLSKSNKANTLKNNLANLYKSKGNINMSLILNFEILNMREMNLGNSHIDVGVSLNNIAIDYASMGAFNESINCMQDALNVFSAILPSNHRLNFQGNRGLGLCYVYTGEYDKGIEYINKSIQIGQDIFRPNQLELADVYLDMAIIYTHNKKYQEAYKMINDCIEVAVKNIECNLPIYTESQKLTLLSNCQKYFNYLDNIELELTKTKKSNVISVFNNSVLLSNASLRSSEAMRSIAVQSNDTLIQNYYAHWISLNGLLNKTINLTKSEILQKGIDIDVLQDSISYYERLLNKKSISFQNELQKQKITYKDIGVKLNKSECYLQFHSFNHHNGSNWTDSTFYVAFILRKDQKIPEMVYLFEQSAIDSLISAPDVESLMGNLYQPSDSALYNLVWKPIAGYLGDAKKVFIAPSGQLHKLAFAAIGDGTGHVLSDKYEIHQVLSAQDFVYTSSPVVFNNYDKSTTTSIAMFGGINYDPSKTTITKQDSIYYTSLSLLSKELNRGSSFGYLPATKKEIESIQSQFKQNNKTTLSYSGLEATEASLRSLEGDKAPKILHIATHGYFAPDPKEDRNKTQVRMIGQENRYTAADNPLLRSGLMMAGSNASWKGTVTLAGEEDGILTAQEVSNLNLLNTQLVVLSACETGLGDIKGREGVFGLQRAFRLAGAKYLLLSLWRIPDEETSEYMQLFYSELLKQNDISKAYKTTQSSMRQKYPNSPMKWAGMVLVE
jgi:tetratricopeptide (TPR) repeat protein